MDDNYFIHHQPFESKKWLEQYDQFIDRIYELIEQIEQLKRTLKNGNA